MRQAEALHKRGYSDPIWWGLAGLVSLAALAVPNYIGGASDEAARRLLAQTALFIGGALVGALRPERTWRWAAASIATFALRDALLAAEGALAVNPLVIGGAVLGNFGVYVSEAVPVLLGATFASWSRAGLD